MITSEQNGLLTRTGPGTPMGELFRRYWIPACLSEEMPEPDCPPVRVKLLGEDLVAFRDTNGQVGLLAENCSHRRASLFYGRNEECGLRCIYHGWKYDVEGNIVDTPAEPAASMLKHHVKHKAYPCRDVNGIIWAYLGPREKMPLLPNTLWFTVPPSQVEVTKFRNESNYLQALEGDTDHPHLAFLHRRGEGLRVSFDPTGLQYEECEWTWWGIRGVMSVPSAAGGKNISSNIFIMPFMGAIGHLGGPGRGPEIDPRAGIHVIYQVPADDVTVTRYDVIARRDDRGERRYREDYHKDLNPDYTKVANKANDYLIDREAQRTRIYCGIDFGNHTQDACVTESMGLITDRTEEHLGQSDLHVIAVRDFLLAAMEAMQRGEDPPGVALSPEQNQGFDSLYCVHGSIASSDSWRKLLVHDAVRAWPGRRGPSASARFV